MMRNNDLKILCNRKPLQSLIYLIRKNRFSAYLQYGCPEIQAMIDPAKVESFLTELLSNWAQKCQSQFPQFKIDFSISDYSHLRQWLLGYGAYIRDANDFEPDILDFYVTINDGNFENFTAEVIWGDNCARVEAEAQIQLTDESFESQLTAALTPLRDAFHNTLANRDRWPRRRGLDDG